MCGATLLDKRRYAKEHLDHLRTALMFEPRGHKDMYGAILVEKDADDADLAVLFIHCEGTLIAEILVWHNYIIARAYKRRGHATHY